MIDINPSDINFNSIIFSIFDNPKDLFFTLISIFLISNALVQKKINLKRPSILFAIFIIIFYQLPLIFFGEIFYTNLSNSILFSYSIHFAVLFNIGWVYITPGLNSNNKIDELLNQQTEKLIFLFFVIFFLILIILYLIIIPPKCTALYAMLFDPNVSLLVREMVGKFMAPSYAPYILNNITSGVAPILVLLSIKNISQCFINKKLKIMPLYFVFLLMASFSILLVGAKGAFVPIIAILLISGLLASKNYIISSIYTIAIPLFLIFTLMGIKTIQEKSNFKGFYNFAECTKELNICTQMDNLIRSFGHEDTHYFFIQKKEFSSIAEKIANTCDVQKFYNLNNEISLKNTITEKNLNGTDSSEMLYKIINRIFISPIKVASYHFQYVFDNEPPGFKGLSISRFFNIKYINVSKRVCELYFPNDNESSCTAPTSFIFSYPAYFGYIGLFFVCLCFILFDIASSFFIKNLPKLYSNITVALSVGAITNFIISDFITVLLTHGLLIIYLMLTFIYIIYKKNIK